ncbi:hypothetical protein [Terrabacter ginsenosidimutans]|uniref:hypothetical protein n=1 Tax=Terrabacter ginsenosidimutans TaxID=490575 RepID=UPI0031E6BA10
MWWKVKAKQTLDMLAIGFTGVLLSAAAVGSIDQTPKRPRPEANFPGVNQVHQQGQIRSVVVGSGQMEQLDTMNPSARMLRGSDIHS